MRPRAAIKKLANKATIGGVVLTGMVLLMVVASRYARQTRVGSAGTSDVVHAEGLQTVSLPVPQIKPDAEAFWSRLTAGMGSREWVLFGIKSATPLGEDSGSLQAASMCNSFETRPMGLGLANVVDRPGIKCVWDAECLRISITTAARPAANQSADAPSHCQLVLGTGDPAVRYRFAAHSSGLRTAHRLTYDEVYGIADDRWSAVIHRETDAMSAEFMVSGEALDHAAFARGQAFPLIVRIGSGPADELDVPITSTYWLLDSLRGFKTQLDLIDDQHREHPSLRFTNGMLMPRATAVQWDFDQPAVRPGEQRTLQIAVYSSGDSEPSALLTGIGKDLPLSVEPADPVGHGRKPLRHYRLIVPPVSVPGLYELKIGLAEANDQSLFVSLPHWVTDDWRQEARQHVLKLRGDIEKTIANPWHKSILLAHVTKALGQVDKEAELGWGFLNALADLQQGLHASRSGGTPQVPTGESKLMFATSGITVEVPAHYDRQLAWPVYWGQKGLPNFIRIYPVELAGYMVHSADLRQAVHIDPDRQYLCDWCGGGYIATDWMVSRPEPWAAAVLAVRARWSPLAANACNVPTLIYSHSLIDTWGLDVVVAKTAYEWMKNQGCPVEYAVLPRYQHGPITEEHLPDTARWLLRHRRNACPRAVRCASIGYENTSKYWVTIETVQEQHRIATLDATVQGEQVLVQADPNVLDYTLDLRCIAASQPAARLEIIENGQSIRSVDTGLNAGVFARRQRQAGSQPAVRKRPGMCGPILSAFKNRRALIIHPGSDANLDRVSTYIQCADRLRASGWLSVEPSAMTTEAMPAEILRSRDLILIGSPSENKMIGEWLDRYSIQFASRGLTVGNRHFDGEAVGLIAAAPNPLNPERFVLFLVSSNAELLQQMARMTAEPVSQIRHADYVVVELEASATPKVVWADQFSAYWHPVITSRTIARLSRPHPDWQWTQLIAEMARSATAADTFFAPRMIKSPPSTLVGEITAHDLYRCIYNDWLCVARLDASRQETLSRLFVAMPDSVVTNLCTPPTAAEAEKGTRPDLRVATPADCDQMVFERGAPVNAYGSSGQACVAEMASECVLTSHYTVDCLVRFLEAQPNLDLDALLDSQQPVSRGHVAAMQAITEELQP